MTKYEFTPEACAESFAEHLPRMTARMAENDVTPEELADFLNSEIDQSGRQAIAALFTDHNTPIDTGGKIHIREINSYESWVDQTGWEPPEE